jgi:hypothetical protein
VPKTSKKSDAKNGKPKAPAVPKAKKPEGAKTEAKSPAKPGKPGAAPEGEAQTVAQARRLTPEAKAQVNAMVAKGIPLGEALRRAASWETFVAPVREEQKPGGDFRMGGGGPGPGPRRGFRKPKDQDDESDENEESSGASDDSDE